MKKNSIYVTIVVLASCVFFSACYQDKSRLPDMTIPGIVVDVSGIPTQFTIGYQEPFSVAPKVTKGGIEVNDQQFEHEWRINVILNRGETDTIISRERVFSGTIGNAIAANPYYLRYKVFDPATGFSKVHSWPLTVVSSFREGLAVCDSKDGTNSDFSLFINSSMTVDWTGEAKVFRNILENSGQGAYPGLLNRLYYHRATNNNYLMAFDQNNKMQRFATVDFRMDNMSEMFVYFPPNLETYYINKPNQELFLVTNAGVMISNPTVTMLFTGVADASLVSTTVNNNVVAVDSWSNHGGIPAAVWYDKPQGRFYWSYQTMFAPYARPFVDKDEPFNAGNYPGKTAIAGDLTQDGNTLAMLMKDDLSGDYGICTFYKDPFGFDPGAKEFISIPAAGKALIDGARKYVFARGQPVLFVVRSEGIYAITFGVNPANVVTVAKFAAPAGEQILFAKLFEQGRYKFDRGDWSLPAELPLNEKALIVATSSSSGGKVYVLPMINLGTGDLNANNKLEFGGFGQILDVEHLGY